MWVDVEGANAIDRFWLHGEVFFDDWEQCNGFLREITTLYNYAVELSYEKGWWNVNRNYQ